MEGMGDRLAPRFVRRRLVALGVLGAGVAAVAASVALAIQPPPPVALVAEEARASESAPAPADAVSADPPKAGGAPPVAVFIGDSYTVGQNTPLEGVGFTALLAELQGWEPVNLAISGTGYAKSHELDWCPTGGCPAYAGVIDDALAADPDIVVVSGGRNDMWLEDEEGVAAAIEAFYSQLRAAFPTERIIVTSPLWSDGPTPAILQPVREQVERHATRVGAEHLDLGDLFEQHPELITDDGIHPTEAGLERIAERIDALLEPAPVG